MSEKRNQFTSEQARVAGHKGGVMVAQRPGHMAELGAKGGRAIAQNGEHMRAIGRKGGHAAAAAKAARKGTTS